MNQLTVGRARTARGEAAAGAIAGFLQRLATLPAERFQRNLSQAVARARGSVEDAAAPALLRKLPAAVPARAVAARVAVACAKEDPLFRAHVAEADAARSRGAWAEAAVAYSAALALYPLHPGYWVQLGHMRKEGGNMAGAEAAYRSARALGAPDADLAEHLAFVCLDRGSPVPSEALAAHATAAPASGRQGNAALDDPPIELEARALWETFLDCPCSDEDCAALLVHETKRALVAELIERPEFAARNRGFFEVLIETGEQGDD